MNNGKNEHLIDRASIYKKDIKDKKDNIYRGANGASKDNPFFLTEKAAEPPTPSASWASPKEIDEDQTEMDARVIEFPAPDSQRPEIETANYQEDEWNDYYAKLNTDRLFYIRANLFDNGVKKNATRFKIGVSYIAKPGEQPNNIVLPIPNKQRDAKRQLPPFNAEIDNIWDHDFYQNLLAKCDKMKNQSSDGWEVEPIVCIAHEGQKYVAGKKINTGPIIPFIAAAIFWLENDFPMIDLRIGNAKFLIDLNMDENISGKKIAEGAWKNEKYSAPKKTVRPKI